MANLFSESSIGELRDQTADSVDWIVLRVILVVQLKREGGRERERERRDIPGRKKAMKRYGQRQQPTHKGICHKGQRGCPSS